MSLLVKIKAAALFEKKLLILGEHLPREMVPERHERVEPEVNGVRVESPLECVDEGALHGENFGFGAGALRVPGEMRCLGKLNFFTFHCDVQSSNPE